MRSFIKKKVKNIEDIQNEILLILGNGFDLYMGLNSRYDNFFKECRYNNYDFTFDLKREIEKSFKDANKDSKKIIEKLNSEENLLNNSLLLLYLIFCDNLKIENDNIWWHDIEKRLLSYLIEIREIMDELEKENKEKGIESLKLNKKILEIIEKNRGNFFEIIVEEIEEYYKNYKISIPTSIEEDNKIIKRYFIKETLKREYKIYNSLKENKILEKLEEELQKIKKRSEFEWDKINNNFIKKIFENEKFKNLIERIRKKYIPNEKEEIIYKIEEICSIVRGKNFPYPNCKEKYKYELKKNKKIIKLVEDNYQELNEIFLKFVRDGLGIDSEKDKLKNIKIKLIEYSQKRDLMIELKKFEKNFGEYINKKSEKIKKIVSLDNFYDANEFHNDAIAPALKIPKIKLDKKEQEKNNQNLCQLRKKINLIFNLKDVYTVINFNYSDYLLESKLRKNIKIKEMLNIHGTWENPIFGIDHKSIDIIPILSKKKYKYEDELKKNKGELKKFIKSSRILYEKKIKNFNLPEINKLKMICVFGHSLAEADYSYFQALFDYYQIYSSNIKLIFLFNNFKNTQREEQNFGIIKLLETYGKSMENKDKGKNLYYKLILEDRIKLFSLEEWSEVNKNKTSD